jgi:hypothetical protein
VASIRRREINRVSMIDPMFGDPGHHPRNNASGGRSIAV